MKYLIILILISCATRSQNKELELISEEISIEKSISQKFSMGFINLDYSKKGMCIINKDKNQSEFLVNRQIWNFYSDTQRKELVKEVILKCSKKKYTIKEFSYI